MKFLLFICLAIVVVLVSGDSACNKNAWVRLNPNSKDHTSVTGSFDITSGKGAWDIGPDILNGALADCFFEQTWCQASKDAKQFYCGVRNEWNSANWVGTGNIEFDCSNKGWHCYDVKWDRT